MRDIRSTKMVTLAPIKHDGMKKSSKYFNHILRAIVVIKVLIKTNLYFKYFLHLFMKETFTDGALLILHKSNFILPCISRTTLFLFFRSLQ